jgi:hypothetical protein
MTEALHDPADAIFGEAIASIAAHHAEVKIT